MTSIKNLVSRIQESMREQVISPRPKPKLVHLQDHEIQLGVRGSLKNFPVDLRTKKMTITIELTNESNGCMKEGTFVIDAGKYFQRADFKFPSILRGRTIIRDIELKQAAGSTLADLPTEISLTLEGTSQSYSISFSMYDFIGDLLAMAPPEAVGSHYNILLFGIAGCGKSSFLNSLFTLTSSDALRLLDYAPVGGSQKHVTTSLVKYKLPNSKISVWDTWGITLTNYKDDEADKLFDGRLPHNWGMFDTESRDLPEVAARVHGITFLASAATFLDPSFTKYRQVLARNIALAIKKDIPFVVVLTKVDEVDQTIRSKPDVPPPTVQRAMDLAAKELSIPREAVVYNLNYYDEHYRSFPLDKLNYRCFSAITHLVHRKHQQSERVLSIAERRKSLLTVLTAKKTFFDESLVNAKRASMSALQAGLGPVLETAANSKSLEIDSLRANNRGRVASISAAFTPK